MIKLKCPGCELMFENIDGHFNQSLVCAEAADRHFQARINKAEEEMRINEPEQFALVQQLKGLVPTSGSDPDFEYSTGQPKPVE